MIVPERALAAAVIGLAFRDLEAATPYEPQNEAQRRNDIIAVEAAHFLLFRLQNSLWSQILGDSLIWHQVRREVYRRLPRRLHTLAADGADRQAV